MKKEESSLTVGANGPVLMQDVRLIEKLNKFHRESIPERVIHAKGAGAHGYFRVYMPMSDYTSADFLQDTDQKTPVFVRFSTMTGSKGSADTARDPRGFAVKFYTREGNYDLLGNSLPVFFIRDAIKYPDLIQSIKPEPSSNLKDSERFWRFISENPESTNLITWLFSDRGTIKSYRQMEGYSINTYVWITKYGKRHFVRYQWKPLLGVKDISRQEAEFLAGFDSDAASRDLYDSLERGEKIEYELCVQLIPFEEKDLLDFNPLDATKIWPERIPLMKVGKMTLNRVPANYFTEVEQAAFSPANIVPGIEFSFDRLLQGMILSSLDSNRHRLGANYNEIPVNKAKLQIDRSAIREQAEYPIEIEGMVQRSEVKNPDYFSQAGDHYRSMSKKEQDHLVENIIDSMMFINDSIQKRVVGYFMKADQEFGTRVAKGLDF